MILSKTALETGYFTVCPYEAVRAPIDPPSSAPRSMSCFLGVSLEGALDCGRQPGALNYARGLSKAPALVEALRVHGEERLVEKRRPVL